MEADDIRAERERHRHVADKMEAVGMLARGLAHDFNNVLSGVIGFTSYLKSKAPPDSDLYRDLAMIEEAGNEATSLTRQLFLIARRRHATRASVPVNEAVEEALRAAGRHLDPGVTVRKELASDLLPVVGDRTHVVLALHNLLLHAAETVGGEEGTLLVRTEQRALTERERQVLVGAGDFPYVCVTVKDSGRGFSADEREHLFDPFYLSRSSRGGTGLRLPIVYGIVANHHGDISVESSTRDEDHGTTYRLYLPAYQEPAAGKAGGAELHGTETVLVVDDEEMIRQVVAEILRGAGYRPLTAESGEQAVDMVRRHGGRMDLVLLDLIMPGMGGEAAFHRIREIEQAVRILLTSVSANEAIGDRLVAQGAAGMVYKPYTRESLLRAVRSALDG